MSSSAYGNTSCERMCLEAQRIGSLDQGVVHPGERCKAKEEGPASVHGQRRQHSNAKPGGRQARDAYPLSLLGGLAPDQADGLSGHRCG